MKIAILGSGPAGLFAALAAEHAGDAPVIYTDRLRPSHLNGAQYLHQPIPLLDCGDPVTVDYSLEGSSVEYRLKVYGDNWDGEVSPDDFTEPHPAWDLRRAYAHLWNYFRANMIESKVIPASIPWLSGEHDRVVSSIPRPALCANQHGFRSSTVVAAGEAPGLGVSLPYECPPNTVRCNGLPAGDGPSWYRLSNIFGHKTVEWPHNEDVRLPPVSGAVVVQKPLTHNCDCWPGVLHVGRYGAWRKGVLSHTAYGDTAVALAHPL